MWRVELVAHAYNELADMWMKESRKQQLVGEHHEFAASGTALYRVQERADGRKKRDHVEPLIPSRYPAEGAIPISLLAKATFLVRNPHGRRGNLFFSD